MLFMDWRGAVQQLNAACCYSAAPHACRSNDDEDEDDEDLSGNKIVQFCKSLTSFTDSYDGDKFFTMQASR